MQCRASCRHITRGEDLTSVNKIYKNLFFTLKKIQVVIEIALAIYRDYNNLIPINQIDGFHILIFQNRQTDPINTITKGQITPTQCLINHFAFHMTQVLKP